MKLSLLRIAWTIVTTRLVVAQLPADCPLSNWPTVAPTTKAVATSNVEHLNTVIAVGKGTINCVGRINQWQIGYKANTCDDLTLQVWRPTGNLDEYELVGQNSYKHTNPALASPCPSSVADGTITWDLSNKPQDQIPVRPGDVVGWKQSTTNGMLTYDENPQNASNTYGVVLTTSCTPTGGAGSRCTFSTQKVRDYSLQARIVSDEQPRFDNIGGTGPPAVPTNFDLREDTSTGTVLYTVRASPRTTFTPSLNHPVHYELATFVPAGCSNMIAINQNTGEISLSSTIDRSNLDNNGGCTFEVRAGIDQRMNTAVSLGITVEYHNLPHAFDSAVAIPNTIQLDTVQATLPRALQNLVVTDPDYANAAWPRSLRTAKTFFISDASPDASIFDIDQNVVIATPPPNWDSHNYGQLRSYKDIRFRREDEPLAFDLNITSSDGVHTAGPVSVRVEVINLRVRPILTLPPASAIVIETDNAPTPALNLGAVTCTCDGVTSYTVRMTNQYPQHEITKFQLLNNAVGTQIQVIPGSKFDYDVTKKYLVEIEITDDNNDDYSDSANLTMEVQRVNKGPQFSGPDPLTAVMQEEQEIGTPVAGLVLDATDRDIKYGDSLSLSIQPGGTWADKFYIIPSSNLLYVRRRIDVDPNRPSFTAIVPVTVTDQESLTATVTVEVTINDINDNAPVFAASSFATSIPENTDFSHTLGTFTATDDDAGVNAEIVYSIENSPTGAKGDYYFKVDEQTGELRVKHPIDYEEHTNVSFTLKATDRGSPALSGAMHVYVAVEDRNDNRPVFTQSLYNVEVPSYTPVHSTVAAILATDADSAATSQVSYFLLRAEAGFQLSSVSGAIITQAPLRTDTKYLLYCYARDHGTLPGELLSDPAIVRIDAFQAGRHLVDMTLDLPLREFTQTMEDQLVANINTIFSPWVTKVWKRVASGGRTVVTFYVLENTATDDIANLEMSKPFVHRDVLLQQLRADKGGTPSDTLLGREFAPFHPVHVAPTHPDWVTETAAGGATVAVLVLLGVAGILAALLLMYKYHVGPFKPKNSPLPPSRVVPAKVGPKYEEEFKLGYGTESEKKMPTTVVIPPRTSVLPSRYASARQRPPPQARATEKEAAPV